MQSSKFTLIPPEIKPDELLPALETIIPPDEITQSDRRHQQPRKTRACTTLPTHIRPLAKLNIS